MEDPESLDDCAATFFGDPLLDVAEDGSPLGDQARRQTVRAQAELPAGYYTISNPASPAIGVGTDCLEEDQLGNARPLSGCDLGAYESEFPLPTPTPTLAATKIKRKAVPAATPTQAVSTCLTSLPPGIIVNGYSIGTQCAGVDGGGIGNDEVVAGGFIAAIDIWGWLPAAVEVCFAGSGGITFLDAATAPRAVSPLAAYDRGGMTCAEVVTPGTVVLAPGAHPAPKSAAVPLTNCVVLTTDALNFRASPGGAVIGYVPPRARLTALERGDGWFKVDNNGVSGWISAEYAIPQGDCG